MRITIKKINEMAAKYGYQLQKGVDYFYWTPLNPLTVPSMEETIAVGIFRLNDQTMKQWEKDLRDKIQDALDADYNDTYRQYAIERGLMEPKCPVCGDPSIPGETLCEDCYKLTGPLTEDEKEDQLQAYVERQYERGLI